MADSLPLPLGFRAYVTNVGVKDNTPDFTVVASQQPCTAAGVFTRSSFAGPSVLVSREHVALGTASAVVVISKNANVATGAQGLTDAQEVVAGVAAALECAPHDVLIASTGVIGRPYPMDRIRAGLAGIPSPLPGTDALQVARGIMTTDTVPKSASVSVGPASIVGVAKGVGMIEPDMATMITMFFTDAEVPGPALREVFRRVVDRTFNCVSVDTDTSTSDTAIILANGATGAVDPAEFEAALYDVADDWVPIYDKSDLPGFFMACGTSGNQFKNAPLAGKFMAAIIDAEATGSDHDESPVQFTGARTGRTINLGAFSRRREKAVTIPPTAITPVTAAAAMTAETPFLLKLRPARMTSPSLLELLICFRQEGRRVESRI